MSDAGNKHTGELDGQTLGQYKIDRQVGQGGMATVYLATQGSIGRTVAIKVMPMHFMHDPNFLQRFEREVQVIAKLQHPRILPVYDYGQVNNRPYIVMAYMPGGTLADLMEKGPIPLNDVVRMVDQIAEGLDHAHREGVTHRDFKPSNVLLDRANNAHLADFGIAKISESTVALTGSGVVGTPAYMAPEMASEGIVTNSVDIYALGVTLYQMLTGRYPFSGDTPLRVMMAHATEPVPDVLVARPDLPAPMAEVIRRSMAKDPVDRYATAGELADALRAAVAGQPMSFKPATPPAGNEATLLESPGGYRQPTPTPAPAYTPPPPGGYAAQSGGMAAGTPPPTPYPAAVPGSGSYPGYAPAEAKKGGCSPVAIIASVIGGLVLLVCIGVALAAAGGGGMLALLAGATETPIPTNTVQPTLTPKPTDAPTATTAPTQSGGFSGGGTTGGGTTTGGTTTGGTTTGGTTDGNAGSGEVTFYNETEGSVCYLYVTEDNANSWGSDRLGTEEILEAGDFINLPVFSGVYDIKAEDCDFNVVDWVASYELVEGEGFALTGHDAALELENNSTDGLCVLYISDPSADNWGRNLIIDSNPIAAGDTRQFAVSSGTWDLRAETCDGREAERYDEDLNGVTTWTITD